MASVRYVSPILFEPEEPRYHAEEIKRSKRSLIPLGWAISVIPLVMTLVVPNGLAMYAALAGAIIALVGIHSVNHAAGLATLREQDLRSQVWFAERYREKFEVINDGSPHWRGDMPEMIHNWCRSSCMGQVTIANIFDPMVGYAAIYVSFEQDADLLLFRMRFI
jgi:hypothetical protein